MRAKVMLPCRVTDADHWQEAVTWSKESKSKEAESEASTRWVCGRSRCLMQISRRPTG